MLRSATVAICLSLAALPALGSDQKVRAEVQHARATSYRDDDPEVAAFTLKFDVRLTNRSAKSVRVPNSGTGNSNANRMTVLAMEAKQPDGTWAYLFQSTFYDTGAAKYDSCTPLSSSGIANIGNMETRLVLLKKQLAGLGKEPTVRLGLWFFCRQPDGQEPITSATTDAFTLRLPTQQP